VTSAAPVRIVGVKRLADYLKRKVEADANLRDVSVRGEISNLRAQKSGNVNFDLKEGDVVLGAFAWSNDAANFPALVNGRAVVAKGAVTTYPQKSTYQLVVREIALEGVGDVHALFEERKKKLSAEGLFAPERKRPWPRYPFRIALVSSRTANGAIDFVTILRERAPHVRVVWFETPVQGPSAPVEISAALRRASMADVDAIVLTRGGGSFEDLFAFSDEAVVRAVAAARHPVLSAIGHTADQQLCDFAADRHVETPTAAAEAIGLDTRELRARIEECTGRAYRAARLCAERLGSRLRTSLVRSRLTDPRLFLTPPAQRLGDVDGRLSAAAAEYVRARETRLRELARRLEARDPSRRLAERGARLQAATLKLEAAARGRVLAARGRAADASARVGPAARGAQARLAQRLALASAHLDGKNPEAILQRGYAIVTHRGTIVRDAGAVPAGETIEARLARGTLAARVESNETAAPGAASIDGVHGNERSG
jgi:exodeoxyribonuclease VII large subunit